MQPPHSKSQRGRSCNPRDRNFIEAGINATSSLEIPARKALQTSQMLPNEGKERRLCNHLTRGPSEGGIATFSMFYQPREGEQGNKSSKRMN